MKTNFSLDNLLNFGRFAWKGASISDLIRYSIVFLLVFAATLLFFAFYIFYLYFFGFGFVKDEKTTVLFFKSDYEKALQIINERDKLFSDIASEAKTALPNPFR